MNNIFKVIWNHATQTWTAVGELASAKGKSKSVKLAAISTALLVVPGGVFAAEVAQTPSTPVAGTVGENVEFAASQRGGLAIATNKVTNQFFGNDRYKTETGLSKNGLGATVNAYDGIAIGNGAVSGGTGSGGNAHVAIGLMAHASGGGADGRNAAVALGAYSLATGQGGTAIGAHSIADKLNSTALGKVAKANGDGSTAVGTNTTAEFQGTALGNTAQALGFFATSIGVNSKANSRSSTSIGKEAVVSGENAIGIGTQTTVNGVGTVAVGSSTNVSSKNVSTLGSNINVGSGRDGAVVLGHGSDAGGDSVVTAVNSAKTTGSPLIYKGFAGNLGDKSKDATNSDASNQGRIVSVGDDTKEVKTTTTIANGVKTTVIITKNVITGKDVKKVEIVSTVSNGVEKSTTTTTDLVTGKSTTPVQSEKKNAKPYTDSPAKTETQIIYGERQIQHVAAGEITEGSTNAINGSQLYQVAKTLGTAAKGLADTLGVGLTEDGKIDPNKTFSQPLTIAEGSDYNKDENGNDKAPITATNVGDAIKNLNSYVNAGWKVATPSTSEDKGTVSIGHTVNFVGLGNVDVDGEFNNKNGTHNINISVDSPLDYASTKAEVGGKKVDVDVVKANDGKWYPKDQVDEDNNPKDGAKSIPSSDIVKKGAKLTDSDTENNPYEKGNAYTYDDKGNITATGYDKTKPESKDEITAGKNGVQLNNVGWATQPDQAVNKDQLDQTVNKSGFYVQQNGKSTLDAKTDSDKVSDTEKVTPNDVVNFVNGNGTVIKAVTTRDANGVDTTNVTFNVDMAEITPETDGSVTGPVRQELLDALDAAQAKVDENPDDEEAKKALEAAQDAVNKAGGNKVANAQNVADMINSSGFTLKTSATADGKKESGDDEIINPGKTVEMVAGKNLTVKQEANGKVTYSMKDDVEFTSVKVGEDKDGKKPVNFTTVKATDASNNDPANKPTTALNVSSSDGKPTQITGVGSTLNVKPVDTNTNGTPTADADKPKLVDLVGTDAAPVNKNAAATVGDLQNMGWVVSSDKATDAKGEYKDVVKNSNEVKFVGKGAAKVSGKTVNGVRTITVDVEAPSVETAKITKNTDGSVTGPAGETLTKALKDAKDALAKLPKDADAATVKAAQDKVNAAQKAIDGSPNSNKVATAQNVAEAINNSGWRTNSTTATGGAKDTLINPGKAVNFESGKNMEVAQTVDKDGNVAYTYKTKDDVQFNSVQLGGDTGPKLTNDGNDLKVSGSNGTPVKITNVADGNISADSKDAVNGSQLHATNEKVANLGTTVNNLGDKVNNLGDTVNNLSGELNKGWSLQANGNDVTAVTSGKGVNFASTDNSVTITPEVDSNGIAKVNLTVNTANVIDKNKGSIKEAATDPKADKAGQVTVTGKPVRKADGSMETQKEANAREGNKLATVGNVVDAINSAKWFAKVENTNTAVTDRTQNDTADKKAEAIGAGETLTLKADKNLAVKREGKNVTYGLASEIDVNSVKATNSVTIGSGDNATKITSNDKGLNLAGKDGAATNINNVKDAELNSTSKQAVNGSQLYATNQKVAGLEGTVNNLGDTVNNLGDTVNNLSGELNKGWSLQANGKDVTAVTSGKGVNFASADDSVTITPEVDSNGIAKVNLTVNTANVIDKNKGSIKEAATDPKADKAGQVTVTGTPVQKADGSMETQDEANAREGNKLATVENVVKAINSAATFVKVADSQEVITASTADDNGVAVKSGDTVTHTAGKNLKVKRDGKSVTYALAQDIDVNSVKATNGVTIGSGDNTTTITSDDKGLNLAGKDGAATNINNVKDAALNSTSKQAVNGSQLHATNEKVANLGTTVNNLSNVINHHAGAIDSLDRKVNKHSKQARAGIAGANAAAALPQAYTQGKAMVAAAAGTFKGQNALAVGYSRISDNGKVILKLQGNANTSGDVGAGVGVGYQW